MTRFVRRRWRNGLITVGLLGLLVLAWRLQEMALADSHFLTGWVLVALIAVLTLLNLRKGVPMLPLGTAADWLQLHIYLGILSGAAFLLHLGPRWPQGGLDIWLAVLFTGVWLSGLIGLVLSRLLPHRAGPGGPKEIFERIPARRARLAREVKVHVLAAAMRNQSATITDLYERSLHRFFGAPRNRLHHLTGSRVHLRSLQRQMQALHRYADEADRATLDALWAQVQEKDRLDRQYALQGTLKLWLFVHIPLTWAMLPVAALHGVLAYAFGAGAR